MGWSDANARGPGVDGEASIGVGILREGLPEAIEKGVVRVLDGPEYNMPASPTDNPNLGPSPTTAIMWHAMSSTSSLKASNRLHDSRWMVGFLVIQFFSRYELLVHLNGKKTFYRT
jgi:hypothetical protein